MWRVYKHTGKDTNYDAYKVALNAATNEVRKSKRNFEHKLAQNIKSDSKSFYAYVRSKQNVRDKVGPLKDNAGNIKTQGFLMAEELNMQFSSVFTWEDTSLLPVPETKFNGSEGERLGQLVVTPDRSLARNGNFFKNAVIQKKLQLHPKPYSYTFFAVVRLTKHTPLRKTHSHNRCIP